MTPEMAARSALVRSMRSGMILSRAACSAVKNSVPSRACSSWGILRRARAAGTFGSAVPGDRVVHDVPAGDSVQVREHAG